MPDEPAPGEPRAGLRLVESGQAPPAIEAAPGPGDTPPGAPPHDPAGGDEPVEGTVIGRWRPPRTPRYGPPGELRPIIPEQYRTWAAFRKHVLWHARRARHHVLYHLVRAPQTTVITIRYAVTGAGWVTVSAVSWWWVAEQSYLRAQAVQANDTVTWLRLHKEVKQTRKVRGFILLGEVIAVTAGGIALTVLAPLGWVAVALVATPLLAVVGRPDDKPILTSAVVPVQFQPITKELIVLALSGLGISEINKALTRDPEKAIVLLDPIMRDGPGWRALVELPHGATAAEVAEKRDRLASGLRRQLGCVWPETEHKRHPGALLIFVGDEDMTTAEQPAWPLAKRGVVDLFQPVPFATDPRGRQVSITLMFASVIIGALPRMGKTFFLRLLLLICALDPRCEIHAYDLKGTGDLSPLEPVAHRYRAGDEPDDIAYLMADLRWMRTELRRRVKVVRGLPRDVCPENKVTTQLASDPRYRLHPIAFAVDETQVIFEHPEFGDEAAEICADLAKRGPAVGIMFMLATQRPDAKSIPPAISAAAVLRLLLKVMGQIENDMIGGTSAHKNGYRGTMFSFDDKGCAWYFGEGRAPQIIRGQYLNGPDCDPIVARARAVREAEGRVTGHAAGEDFDTDPRSFLEDVIRVFGDAKSLWLASIAALLNERMASVYDGITATAVGSQLRAAGITVKKVREPGREGHPGVERKAVEDARDAVPV